MLDPLLRPVQASLFARAARPASRLHPDAATYAALGAGVLCVGLAASGRFGLALVAFLLNRFLDGLDGALARVNGTQRDLGGYLDIMADFVTYAAVPIAVVWGLGFGRGPAVALALLLAAYYVNAASWLYLSAILEKRAAGAAFYRELTTITMPRGLIGGAETIVFYTLVLLFPAHVIPLFGAMAGALIVTIGQRIGWAFRNL